MFFRYERDGLVALRAPPRADGAQQKQATTAPARTKNLTRIFLHLISAVHLQEKWPTLQSLSQRPIGFHDSV